MTLNPTLMFCLVSDKFKTLSTHIARVILLSSLNILLATIVFLFFVKYNFEWLETKDISGLECMSTMRK